MRRAARPPREARGIGLEHRKRYLYAAAWLPYLTFYLAGFVANGVPLGFAVRNALATGLPDALLGVAVLRIPRLLPWPEGRRTRFFAAHLGFLAAFILGSAAVWVVLVNLDSLLFKGSLGVRINAGILPWRALNDALIYCALVAISYAWLNAAAGREQAARAARAEALRARAELEALRSQLNPHFILNTFHALVGLVRRQPAVAEEALERLGDLLRYSLRVQREKVDEVALRDEWAFVQGYLELERLRLGDRLRLSLEAPAITMDCMVPSFALQTLVENAIRHAIAPRAGGGLLAVSAREVKDRLRIEVEDEGRGTGEADRVESHGLGLRLLQERLAALYEGQASLELSSTPAGGVRAVLDLAARRAAAAGP
jgi:two-component system LytT family sensor kinase